MYTKISEQLQIYGFETTAQGEVSLSGLAKKAYGRWSHVLTEMFAVENPTAFSNPLTISKQILDISKYSEHFPQQTINVVSGKGEPIGCCTPASCLHVYPKLLGQNINKMNTFLVQGTCARFEDGKWAVPFRLPFFTMLEFVVIGSEAEVRQRYDSSLRAIEGLFAKLNIKGGFEFATDAFFLAENEGAKLMQKLKGLKREYVGTVENNPVALASLNFHEDYFSKSFSITRDGTPAFSACIAFGLERLTAYSLIEWGEEKNWPTEFRYE